MLSFRPLALHLTLILGLAMQKPGFCQQFRPFNNPYRYIAPQRFWIPVGPPRIIGRTAAPGPIITPQQTGGVRAVNRQPGIYPIRTVFRPPLAVRRPIMQPARFSSQSQSRRSTGMSESFLALLLAAAARRMFNTRTPETTAVPSTVSTMTQTFSVATTVVSTTDSSEWGQWSDWTTCSRDECGVYQRTRVCIGGNQCIGNNEQISICNAVRSCQYAGVWGEWSSWGSCNPLCNGGTREKTRECSTVGSCEGSATESQACPNDHPNRFEYDGLCYEVIVINILTHNFVEAETTCRVGSGVPADILTQAQQELFIQKAKDALGTQPYNRPEFWLGMTVDTNANVKLSTGQPAPYVAWAGNAPITVPSSRNRIVLRISISGDQEGLDDQRPTSSRRGVICAFDPWA